MNILWVTNIMLPDIAKAFNIDSTNREGWLTGVLHKVKDKTNEYQISIAYPTMDTSIKECTILNGIHCYPFYEDLMHPELYEKRLEELAKKILDKVNPDILHIYGTEFPHTLSFIKAFNNPKRTVVSIQGICSMIAKDYMAMLPKDIQRSITFRDIIKRDSIIQQQMKFRLRAVNENEALSLTGNVIGRTFFDKRYAFKVNPSVNYYTVNETMRDSFYHGKWNVEQAVPHSIFIGQGDYPIKGLHFVFESLASLVSKYSDLSIRIAGNSIINNVTLKDKLKAPAYGKYLRRLIENHNLEGHVTMLGSISEEDMKKEYLRASIYICASYVENSPNTLAEAMLLGVPVVTSDAGGITDMISYNEAHIFRKGNVEELTSCIDNVWILEDNNDARLNKLCERTVDRAKKQFDGDTNYKMLIDTYSKIIKEN